MMISLELSNDLNSKGIHFVTLNSYKVALFRSQTIFFFLLFIFLSVNTNAQHTPDTLQSKLNEVVVVGYETSKNILATAASISVIPLSEITHMDHRTLLDGLNTVAGVQMEERAAGSYRISIRGSSLRSPFGIRNVKVYWNGLPFTEPSGVTFLNLLDVSNMQSVEVLKGPAGSLYGAGNGGVLHIDSTVPIMNDQLKASTSVGSFGALAYQLGYHQHFEHGRFSWKYAHQQSEGYREQNHLNRQVMEITGEVEYQPSRTLAINLLYSDLDYGIPGGLTAEQFSENPTQARPGTPFTLGSIEAQAGVNHKMVFTGITHQVHFNTQLSNISSVFGNFSDFNNPFNLDYKIESRKSGGVRSLLLFNTQKENTTIEMNAGLEYQASNYASRNYTNNYGHIGSLNFDDELNVQTTTYFASAELEFPANWIVNTGLSYNTVQYHIQRLATFLEGDFTGTTSIHFSPQLVPRFSIAKRITSAITIYTGVGYGFSPPTLEEVRTNEGSINLDLQPEQGTNLETGIRGYTLKGRFSFDASVFYYSLNNSIVQQQSERGTTLFENSGSTSQLGLELNTHVILYDSPTHFLKQATWRTAYTFHRFRFDTYRTSNGDFSGNELTGVAPNVVYTSISAQTKASFYANVAYTFNDRIPLTDDNSVYSEAYHLLKAKLGWGHTILDRFEIDASLMADNLLNQTYSRGYDLNAFGGRYYQPAPGRNWMLSFSIRYTLD